MKNGITTSVSTLLLAVLILTPSASIAAQQTAPTPLTGSWDVVKTLPSRDTLSINLRDGSQYKGRLIDVTDATLTLTRGKKKTEIQRDNIRQIYRFVPRSRTRGTVTGAAVGAGLGVMTAAAGDSSTSTGVAAAIVGISVLTCIGAFIGRGIASAQERVLIYDAR